MANLKEIRTRITSVRSTQTITKAMKLVAAAKLRRAQERITGMQPYTQKLQKLMNGLAGAIEDSEVEVFYKGKEEGRTLIIAVSSDRGLAGSFNSSIGKELKLWINEKGKIADVDILPAGKKIRDIAKRNGFNAVYTDNAIFSDLTYDNSNKIAKVALDGFISGKYNKILVIYNHFKNAATFIPTVEQLLPIAPPEARENVAALPDYIFEPNKTAILKQVVLQTLKMQIFKAIIDSNAAEHGARMTAMDKATDNAEELLKDLKLEYNRARQASITKELIEIVAGAQALEA